MVLKYVFLGLFLLGGFIIYFAKKFYKHRQKRWQIVAENNIKFSDNSL